MRESAICLQCLVAASIFYVWVVRYANIVTEFESYRLPVWMRDLVGIVKLTSALLLLVGIERPFFAIVGAFGIIILMAGAVVTHLRVRNPVFKMIPALCLLACSAVIAWINYRILA